MFSDIIDSYSTISEFYMIACFSSRLLALTSARSSQRVFDNIASSCNWQNQLSSRDGLLWCFSTNNCRCPPLAQWKRAARPQSLLTPTCTRDCFALSFVCFELPHPPKLLFFNSTLSQLSQLDRLFLYDDFDCAQRCPHLRRPTYLHLQCRLVATIPINITTNISFIALVVTHLLRSFTIFYVYVQLFIRRFVQKLSWT